MGSKIAAVGAKIYLNKMHSKIEALVFMAITEIEKHQLQQTFNQNPHQNSLGSRVGKLDLPRLQFCHCIRFYSPRRPPEPNTTLNTHKHTQPITTLVNANKSSSSSSNNNNNNKLTLGFSLARQKGVSCKQKKRWKLSAVRDDPEGNSRDPSAWEGFRGVGRERNLRGGEAKRHRC